MDSDISVFQEISQIWISGGWLMLPLLFLTVFIYYTALELLLRVNTNTLLRLKVNQLNHNAIEEGLSSRLKALHKFLLLKPGSVDEVRLHFKEVQKEIVPIINRRIKSLSIIITAGPLVGLLGTVTGMLSTFQGMGTLGADKFDSIVNGISEALITTQAGLIISIPAFIILSIIIQQRNTLVHCLARLERYNVTLALQDGGDK